MKLRNKPTIEKTEIKATPSVEELAQAVKSIEDKVENQRTALYFKRENLKDQLTKPVSAKVKVPDSFDIADIENQTVLIESEESIIAKIKAIDLALERPACYDSELLGALHEYLLAIRPIVEEMDAKQWQILRQISSLEHQIAELNGEFDRATGKVENLISLARLYAYRREYDKRRPMNGLWGIASSLPFTDLVDSALQRCNSGEEYSVISGYSNHVIIKSVPKS